MSSRRAALAGLATYSACTTRALVAQRAAWMAILLFGPRMLPGRSFGWRPGKMDDEVWADLAADWRRDLGDFDAIAGYERLQQTRAGLALLLLRRGEPVAFIKMRDDGPAMLRHEALAMRTVWQAQPRMFRVTEPIAEGERHGWHYAAAQPLPPTLHRPERHPPMAEITDEISLALASLPKPAGTPDHWRPMHGDFTPWNLRSVDGQLYLIDWENAAWGPPGADEVYYRATAGALWGTPVPRSEHHEALEHWRHDLLGRLPTNERDAHIRTMLLRAFTSMAG